MTMNSPGAMLVAGNIHLRGLLGLSLRNHPPRLTGVVETFWISIQSANVPSASARVRLLAAINSVIMTWPGHARETIRRLQPRRDVSDFMLGQI